MGLLAGGKGREAVDGSVRGVCCEIAILEGVKEAWGSSGIAETRWDMSERGRGRCGWVGAGRTLRNSGRGSGEGGREISGCTKNKVGYNGKEGREYISED